MNQTRIMPGIVDMEGETVNSLRVGRMVQRHPRPRYETTCQRCGTRSTESQDRLVSGAGRCMAAHCGKTTTKRSRDLLAEQRQRLADREAERIAEEREVSERRMAADADGYQRPTKYTPNPTPPVMTERERQSLREFRESEEAAQREAERPAREKAEREQQRIAELQGEQENTLRQLHAIQRDRIANGKDDEFVIDPATLPGEGRTGVPFAQVAEWQQEQFAEFLKNNPDYHRCDENAKTLTDYIERNVPGGLPLLSAAQLTAAYKRLNEYGLLKQRPAPHPAEQPRQVNLTIAPAKAPSQPQPVMFDGWDEDGNPRQYSEREVSRWSSEEMKRRLRLYPDKLTLPNVGPGPLGYDR